VEEKPDNHDFKANLLDSIETKEHLMLDDIGEVKLSIAADLGSLQMSVREVLELRVGSVVQLNKMAGEMTDLSVNNLPFAKGEIVVLGDSLNVRFVDFMGITELDYTNDT